jgi:hypothetical protein
MGRTVARKLRGVLIGLGTVFLLLVGFAALGAGDVENNPPLAPLLLSGGEIPNGFVENAARSGPLDPGVIRAMGMNPAKANTGGAPGWVRDWTAGNGTYDIRILVGNAFNPGWAVQSEQAGLANLRGRGFQQFAVPGVAGAVGETGIFGTEQSSAVLFARGSLFFSVDLATPTQFGAAKNLEAVIGLATLQLRKEAKLYTGTVSHKFDPSFAAGSILGGALGYLLIVGGWAYYRDPFRRDRRRRLWRRSPTPVPAGGGIDVTNAAGRLKRTARVIFWLQLGAGLLVVEAFFPHPLRTRLIFAVSGVVLAGLLALYQRRRGAQRGAALWLLTGSRPIRVTALFIVAIVAGLLGCEALSQGALYSGGGAGSTYYLLSAACWLAAAGITLRRAHRLSAVSAQKSLERDQRPMVLYLRSFGDDGLRLRSATLGRRSLIERFSPNRFDSFEEIIVRHLSNIGPVVAVNPPGTTLAPLGAARATLPQDDWQGVVDDWMERAALIVIGAPPGTASPGLAWEIRHVTEHDRWSKTLIVVPPVPARELSARWESFAAEAAHWPSGSELKADPARILAMARRDGTWTAITAATRTEWSYTAAINARSQIQQAPSSATATPGQQQLAVA